MKWVTREHPHTDRIACPWLIRRFIDPAAEIVYVPRDDVLPYAERERAISFDTPGARYTHRDGLCTFEVLIDDHGLGGRPGARSHGPGRPRRDEDGSDPREQSRLRRLGPSFRPSRWPDQFEPIPETPRPGLGFGRNPDTLNSD